MAGPAPVPRLHVLVDPGSTPELKRFVADVAAGGAQVLHLRARGAPAGRLAAWVAEARAAVRPGTAGLAVVVNDRADVALVAGADGVHLPEEGLPPAAVRRLVAVAGTRRPFWIGRSVHGVREAAASEGADFLFFGHVYPTPSKPGVPPRGVAALAAVVRASPCPVVAIGGIEPGRVPEVLEAGAWGVAVQSGVTAPGGPAEAVGRLWAALQAVLGERG